MDVYSQLYELAGLTEPPTAERTKPPCCGEEDGKPPVPDSELLADLVVAAGGVEACLTRAARLRPLRGSSLRPCHHVPFRVAILAGRLIVGPFRAWVSVASARGAREEVRG
jgi:hypothetical protein